MSRIRVIEAKVKKEISHSVKKKNEADTNSEKDDVEKDQMADLLAKLPKLAKSFDVHRKIGEGTFSSVYLGSLKNPGPNAERKLFAIKHLVPTTHPTRVAHELRCLRDMGGKNHVISVDLCLRNLDSVVFIMPYIPHRKFSEYVGDMDADELRRYLHALFTALRHVHTFGVIHRDVKPSNFLYDRENRRYALVDFGLAQHMAPMPEPSQPPPAHQTLKRAREGNGVLPDAKRVALDLTMRSPEASTSTANTNNEDINITPPPAHSNPQPPRVCSCAGVGGVCAECLTWAPPRANRAGTQGFRPPEVLFKYAAQSTAVDMWAVGVVMASVLSGRYPFFRATDDMTALAEITALLGTPAMHRTATALDWRTLEAQVGPIAGRSASPPRALPPPPSDDDQSGCRLLTSTPRHGICLRKLSAHLRSGTIGIPHPMTHCPQCRLGPPQCVCLDTSRPAWEIVPGRWYGNFPDSAYALAARLLEPDPRARVTAAEALRHPFMLS